MKIIPATKENIKEMYPELPKVTVKALCVVDGDKIVGIAGTYITDGRTVIFAKLSEELKKNKRIIIVAANKILSGIKSGAFAMCDPNIDKAPEFLLHFGFEPIGNGIWAQRQYQ